MVEEGKTLRKINGEWVTCQDIGCDDFAKARANRQRIASRYALEYWRRLEDVLEGLRASDALPEEYKNLDE